MKTFAKAFFIYIFNIVFKSKWSIIGTEWRGGLSKLTKTKSNENSTTEPSGLGSSPNCKCMI